MDSKKEAEYIAEIVTLKHELKKAQSITMHGVEAKPSELRAFVSQAINQMNDTVGGDAAFSIFQSRDGQYSLGVTVTIAI